MKQRARKPQRQTPKASGVAKASARRRYTPKPAPPRQKAARRIPVRQRQGKGLLGAVGCNHQDALARLRSAGYVSIPRTCPCCRGFLSEPHSRSGRDGHIEVRCTSYGCHRRFSVLRFSPFKNCRLTVGQVAMVVHEYTNADRIAPPPVNDIAGDCEASRDAVEAIVDVLRAKEGAVAKRANRRGQLSGDLEGDEHGIRSFHVSKAVVFVSAQVHCIHTP